MTATTVQPSTPAHVPPTPPQNGRRPATREERMAANSSMIAARIMADAPGDVREIFTVMLPLLERMVRDEDSSAREPYCYEAQRRFAGVLSDLEKRGIIKVLRTETGRPSWVSKVDPRTK